MTDRKQYIERIEKDLDGAEELLAKLRQKTEQFDAEMKEKATKHLEILKEQHDTLTDHLKKAEVDSEDAWDDFKRGLDEATSTLKTNLERTAAALQK